MENSEVFVAGVGLGEGNVMSGVVVVVGAGAVLTCGNDCRVGVEVMKFSVGVGCTGDSIIAGFSAIGAFTEDSASARIFLMSKPTYTG